MKKLLIFIFLVLAIGFVAGIILTEKPNNIESGKLSSILINLTQETTIKNGDCLSYALYYKEYLNKNYPTLDVRKIDMAGICPIGTKECKEWEGMPHTYLIVNGYAEECILDQKLFVCIKVIK